MEEAENREDDKEKDRDEDEETHADEERQGYEEEDVDEMTLIEGEEDIKLKKPQPGSKIADLTNIIEAQVHSLLNNFKIFWRIENYLKLFIAVFIWHWKVMIIIFDDSLEHIVHV